MIWHYRNQMDIYAIYDAWKYQIIITGDLADFVDLATGIFREKKDSHPSLEKRKKNQLRCLLCAFCRRSHVNTCFVILSDSWHYFPNVIFYIMSQFFFSFKFSMEKCTSEMNAIFRMASSLSSSSFILCLSLLKHASKKSLHDEFALAQAVVTVPSVIAVWLVILLSMAFGKCSIAM